MGRWRVNRAHEFGHRAAAVSAQAPQEAMEMLAQVLGLELEMVGSTRSYARSDKIFVIQRASELTVHYHVSTETEVNAALQNIERAKPEHRIHWWYMTKDGPASSEMILHGLDPTDEFYPWLGQSVDSFADEFAAAKANVLVLNGAPGTGKTTFIRRLVRQMRYQTWVTYDAKIQENEEFYVDFATPNPSAGASDKGSADDDADTSPDRRCLVMEDCDDVLSKRSDGNKLMARILNLSDGITTLLSRKIIFSTNLPGAQSIDEALLRKGRCFALIRFRELTRAEGIRAAASVGIKLTCAKTNMTLSEALNGTGRNVDTTKAIGF